MAGAGFDLYGSSFLSESSFAPLLGAFASGSTAIPLGHDPVGRFTGLAFDLGPGGDPGHALTFGATRSGKGVNTIIPALLTYEGSVVVIDPKGENSWITGAYRSTFSRVVILDPWNEVNERYGSQVGVSTSVTRFNPLSALDPAGKDFADDVLAIADALIIPGRGDSHWSESARDLIAGLIVAVVEQSPGKGSLRDVRKLLVAPTPVFIGVVMEIVENTPDSLAARKLARFTAESREIDSIRSVAQTQTAILDSPTLLEAMETDEEPFNLAEIGTGKVSLYLVLPVDKLTTHGRWLRLVLTLAIRILSRQRKPPRPPVLIMLDEMGTIGPLAMIEQSFGLMAGLGIRIWGFLQDLSQLQRDYPQSWETFWSNASIVQVLNCGDQTTSKHISEYLGTKTVNSKAGSESLQTKPYSNPGEYDGMIMEEAFRILETNLKWSRSKCASVSNQKSGNSYDVRHFVTARNLAEQRLQQQGFSKQGRTDWTGDQQLAARPVLFPFEVRDSPADSSIIIRPGRGNFRLKRFTYFSDEVLSGRARHDPNKPAPFVVKDEVSPPPAAAAPPAPPPTSPPGPGEGVLTGEELATMGKELGKKAASAAASFLKDRFAGPR